MTGLPLTNLPELVVYSRPGCHLCEQFIEDLMPLCRGRARIVVRNVDLDRDWREAYGLRIPVLCYGDREVSAVELDRAAVLELLAETESPAGGWNGLPRRQASRSGFDRSGRGSAEPIGRTQGFGGFPRVAMPPTGPGRA